MDRRIPFERFRRLYHSYKKTHYSRYVGMANFKIPRGAILHLSNGLGMVSEIEPSLEEMYQYVDPDGLVWMTCNTLIDPQFVAYEPPTEQFRSIATGVKSRLTRFKTEHTGSIKIKDRVESLVDARVDLYSVCHHAAIKSVRLVGRFKEQRFYQHLFEGVVDTMQRLPEGSTAYYPIVVKDYYQRTDFLSLIRRGFAVSTVTRPEDPVYHLIAHLLLKARSSEFDHAFKEVTEEATRKIHFIFTNGTIGFIYSLYDLLDRFSGDNIVLDKWFGQINGLTDGTAQVTDVVDDEEETEEIVPEESKRTVVETPVLQAPPPTPPKQPKLDKKPKLVVATTKQKPTETMKVIDAISDEVLTTTFSNPDTVFTDRQKDTLRNIATKYKTLEVDGRPLADILSQSDGSDPVKKKDVSFLKEDVQDEHYLQASLINFNKEYINNHYEREVLQTAVSFNKAGLFLTDVKKVVTKNDMEDYTTYTFQYHDEKLNRCKPIHIKLPNPQPDGSLKSRGAYKQIARQRLNVPICKVSATRVALASDYLKAQVEWLPRNSRGLVGEFKKLLKRSTDTVKYYSGSYTDPSTVYPVELTMLADQYKTILTTDYQWTFKLQEIPYDETTGLWLVTTPASKQQHYLDMDNRLHIYQNGRHVATTTYLQQLADTVGSTVPVVNDYTTVSLLSKDIPVGILLAYRYGVTTMLNNLGIVYDIYPLKDQTIPADYIQVRLLDGILAFPKYPYRYSLVAAGLCAFKLKDYSLEELDDRSNYHTIFERNGIAPGYLRGVDNFFTLFVDMVTHGILETMGEPTTVSGLLVRATEMLATREHAPSSSVNNFRNRAHGKIPAMMYHEIAKQVAVSRSNTLKGDTISVNPEAVFQRILQDPLTNNIDTNNPTGSLRDATTFTYAGHGGRTEESFVVRDRAYPKNARGIVSEASVDSGSVGFRAYYSVDANVINMYGMEQELPKEDLHGHNLQSFSSCLIAGALQDDPKRVVLTAAQTAQSIGTAGSQPSRLRTSYERVLPHLVGPPFTYVAEQDGKVIADDTELQMMKIQYRDGTLVSVPYGDQISKYSGIGLHVNQAVVKHSKLGKTFKANDVLTYNREFFAETTNATSNIQVLWKQGTNLIVAFADIEGTQEDASVLSEKAMERMTFSPVHEKELILSTANGIVAYADIGAILTPITNIMTFEEDEDQNIPDSGYDEETIAFIQDLNRKTPKSGYAGEVVDIKVYYKSPLSSMSGSMRKFIQHVEGKRNKLAKFTKGTVGEVSAPHPLEYADKVGYTDLEEDTVIVKYYIRGVDKLTSGSKLSIHSALKTVPSLTTSTPYRTVDEMYEVDLVYARVGLFNRVVWSGILAGSTSLLCLELERQTLRDAGYTVDVDGR